VQSIETENLQLIKALLTGFATRDWPAIRDTLAQNVVFHFPGGNSFSGDYKGREQSLEMLARVTEWTEGSMRVKLHDVLANEQHGVVMYTVSAKHEDKAISYRYIDIYHIRDGQIIEVWGSTVDSSDFDDFYS
jgi:uncharacterized protein